MEEGSITQVRTRAFDMGGVGEGMWDQPGAAGRGECPASDKVLYVNCAQTYSPIRIKHFHHLNKELLSYAPPEPYW